MNAQKFLSVLNTLKRKYPGHPVAFEVRLDNFGDHDGIRLSYMVYVAEDAAGNYINQTFYSAAKAIAFVEGL